MYNDKADKKGRRKFCMVLCVTLLNLRSAEQFLAILYAVVFHIKVRKLVISMKMCTVIHSNFASIRYMRRKREKKISLSLSLSPPLSLGTEFRFYIENEELCIRIKYFVLKNVHLRNYINTSCATLFNFFNLMAHLMNQIFRSTLKYTHTRARAIILLHMQ